MKRSQQHRQIHGKHSRIGMKQKVQRRATQTAPTHDPVKHTLHFAMSLPHFSALDIVSGPVYLGAPRLPKPIERVTESRTRVSTCAPLLRSAATHDSTTADWG